MNTSAPQLADHGERLAVGFCRVLRAAGLDVPATATINFAEALGVVGATNRASVYWAGRSTLVHRPEDLNLYDKVFAVYWQQREPAGISVEGTHRPPESLFVEPRHVAPCKRLIGRLEHPQTLDAGAFSRTKTFGRHASTSTWIRSGRQGRALGAPPAWFP